MFSTKGRLIIILGLGVLSVSSAAIWIRLASLAAGDRSLGFSLFLGASRLGFASLFLLPWWSKWRQQTISLAALSYSILAGVSLACHFAAWMTAVNLTTITAATVLVTTNPLWVGLYECFYWQQKLSLRTWVGMTIALTGVIAIALDSSPSIAPAPLWGNLLALAGALFVSAYLLLGRTAQKRGLSMTTYITLAYTTAALCLLPFPYWLGQGYWHYPQAVYVYVLGMAIFPQLIGHTSFNWALNHLSPTTVSLIILLEPVSSTLLGIIFLGEIPSNLVLLGGIILLLGVAIAVSGQTEGI